jgi:hypothetical protein
MTGNQKVAERAGMLVARSRWLRRCAGKSRRLGGLTPYRMKAVTERVKEWRARSA